MVVGGVAVLALMALATINVGLRVVGVPFQWHLRVCRFSGSRCHCLCPRLHPEEERPHCG